MVTTPLSREVVHASAQIRAMTRLKLPDAIVVGSAAVDGADLVICNDAKFDRLNAGGRMEVLNGARRVPVPAFLRLDEYV